MTEITGPFYHVYNRGCGRQEIFQSHDNYIYLLAQAKRLLSQYPIVLIAYCLMPNHYHFLLRSSSTEAIGRFMQRLFSGYVQAYNRQQRRRGTLFEGRAKSILVETREYGLQLCRYIHLNPVVAGLVRQPQDWPYSNFLEWIGRRAGTLIDRDLVRLCFPDPKGYQAFVQDSIEEALAAKPRRFYLE